MSKKIIITFLFAFVILVGLSGCDPIPTCAPGSLLAPDLVSPDWRDVMDGSSAQLEWSYPDTCEPDQFEIILSKERDYSVIEHTQLVMGNATIYTPPTLDIAEEYFWRVRAKVGSTFGDYSHELRSFFTLPYCTSGQLFNPSPLLPVNGGVFVRGYDSLEWEWPISSCIPESYRVELSTEPDFVDTSLNGATGSPGTRWGPGSPLAAATQYWWRITAFADGTWGSHSIAFSFITDPVCTAASLVTPVAETPINNDIVSALTPEFTWSYPDLNCLPEGFHLKTAETQDMSIMFIDADNPNIASRSMQAGYPFNDCQEYYYSVAVVSEGVESAYTVPKRFIIDATGSCDCIAGATTIPVQTGPDNYEILPDTYVNLEWRNPGGCFPDGAAVKISKDFDFAVSDDQEFPGTFVTGYDPPGLDPATQYRWKAAYYMEESGSPVIGDYSGPRSFFTGPECTSLAEVVAPVRIAPADGSVVNTLTPALKYTTGIPGCIPDGYLLHLHTLADFSDPNLLGEFSLPGTTVLPDPPLTDCTWHYWTVAAVQDAGYGPASDRGSFFVDVDGTCPPAAVPGIPATARQNNFCRIGTYPEHHEAIWTFIAGEHVLVIARNPFTTYLQLMVLDQETKLPFEKVITCWSLLSNFEPGWQIPSSQVGKFSFSDLPVAYPPPTPTPTYCNIKMSSTSCVNAGGTYNYKDNYCECP